MIISKLTGLTMALCLTHGWGGAFTPAGLEEDVRDEARAVSAVLEFLTAEGLNEPWGEPRPGGDLRDRLPFRVAPVYLREGERRHIEGWSLGREASLRNVTDQIVARGVDFAAVGPAVMVRDCTEEGCIGQSFDFLPTEVLAVERPEAETGELELTLSFIQMHWSEGDLVRVVGATTVRVKVAGHQDPAVVPTVELLQSRESSYYLTEAGLRR